MENFSDTASLLAERDLVVKCQTNMLDFPECQCSACDYTDYSGLSHYFYPQRPYAPTLPPPGQFLEMEGKLKVLQL